jgi:DNA-binding CsgD family transcriptional regulator
MNEKKSLREFKDLIDGIMADSTPLPTPKDDQIDAGESDWKTKTAPPTFCPVALADARQDPIVKTWISKRVDEMLPAIAYKASRLHYLDMLHDMPVEDARQEMVKLAMEKAHKDPLWFASDNALCAHDAGQRVRGTQHKTRAKHQKHFSYSLDEYTDTNKTITRLDSIASTLAKTWLTFDTPNGIEESELLPALRDLTDLQRSCFILTKFWNQPTADTAQRLGIKRNTVLSHNHRAKKSLAVSLSHLNHNRLIRACPTCGGRNVKQMERSKKLECRVCGRVGTAKEFEKTASARVFYTGRNLQPFSTEWLRVPAEAYPIERGERPATLGPTIPEEHPPRLKTLPDWTPAPPPSPEKFDLYTCRPFHGAKSPSDLEALETVWQRQPVYHLATRRIIQG